MNTETLELKPIQISIQGIKLIKDEELKIRTLDQKIEMIKTLVLGTYSQTWDQINVKSRKREFVLTRQLISYFLRTKLNIPLKSIGEKFVTGRNHATVMNSIDQVKNLIDTDKKFKRDFDKLNLIITFEMNL